jgi:CRP-like cAMP-binding protein
MFDIREECSKNVLLRALTPSDLDLLFSSLTPVRLDRGTVIIQPDEPIADAYFLTSGLASVIAISSEAQSIEVGLLGRDGVVGTPLLLDADRSPHRVFMQVSGAGLKIAAPDLDQALDKSTSLRKTLLRYVQAFQTQIAYTALSNVIHTIEERLARWLLMTHDRQDSDEIGLTHGFMALMLGARRPSVTIALHSLEGLGFIKSTRGLVLIKNRAELQMFAGAAYGRPEAEYERLIGRLR